MATCVIELLRKQSRNTPTSFSSTFGLWCLFKLSLSVMKMLGRKGDWPPCSKVPVLFKLAISKLNILKYTFNSCLSLHWLVVHEWLRAVFQTKHPDPYLLTHKGQTRRARGPVHSTRLWHICHLYLQYFNI